MGVFAGAGLDIGFCSLMSAMNGLFTDVPDEFYQYRFGKTNGLFANAGVKN